MRLAVFLDRDDTLMDTHGVTKDTARPGDLFDTSLVRLLPGVAPALKRLKDAGYVLVVYTSQGAVARGGGGLREVERVNDRLRELLKAESGVTLDGLYYCPYHPEGTVSEFTREHDWRKPSPGMILTAAAEMEISIKGSWAVGDMPRDVQCAVTAGIAPGHAILIGEGGAYGARDVAGAADIILRQKSVEEARARAGASA